MPEIHAKLSASSAKRWLNCTPSVKLSELFPDEGKSSPFAAEGTAAHSLAELKLKYDTGKIKKSTFTRNFNKFKRENEWYSQSFDEAVDEYVGQVNEAIGSYGDQVTDVLLEQQVDFSEWVPEGFGTSDVVILAEPVLHIYDLKFGRGVPVSAEENPQLMLYALGAYNEFNLAYDFETIKMSIVQPRLGAQSTYELSLEDLLTWAEEVVKPNAEKAMAGEGEFNPGEDTCRWCPAKAVCKARAEKNLEIARYEFEDARVLSKQDISDILDQADEIKKWIEAVQEYALTQVRDLGEKIPGWKLVEGRSNRKLADAEKAVSILTAEGFKDIFKPQELKTLTVLEKMVGKKQFNELLGDIITKPQGKPTLVTEDDKRPEINSVASAIADFEGEE